MDQMATTHWMDVALEDMTPAQMRKFIIFQNTYSYDGDRPTWHRKEELAKFCDLPQDHPAYAKFSKVYDKVTAEHIRKLEAA
jgi:hypothetical protein